MSVPRPYFGDRDRLFDAIPVGLASLVGALLEARRGRGSRAAPTGSVPAARLLRERIRRDAA